ncbi:hypothetical protein GJAV_G00245770 [Gymnothorax javanicus]|nr:hypothetical protein GJAV_G00245770 [Gymnothorax javanicus]
MGNHPTIGECTGVLQNEVYSLGKGAGVIPDYRMDRSFVSYLSPNSSTYLDSHYKEVRRALSPDRLGAFDHSLRATLGQNGTVKHGGVGVVALALSFLFDVLAQQAKNHFIVQIFGEHQDVNSSGLEVGTVVIDYLNLVPLIANDPQRMKEETERYEKKLHHSLVSHFESTTMSQNSSWAEWKIFLHGLALHQHMMIHKVLCMSAEEFEEWKENEGWEEAEEEEVDEDEKTARALSYKAIPQLTPAWKQLIHTSAKISLDSYGTDLHADRELLEDREAYGKLRSRAALAAAGALRPEDDPAQTARADPALTLPPTGWEMTTHPFICDKLVCECQRQNKVYSLGKDAGVIPDYRVDPSFESYLSPNSSTYLDSHYKEVRRALSPDQLGAFDRSLRATLGQNGTVKQGGVGMVALALSLLFDVLAQQAKNQTQKTHFIHQIFGEHQDVNSSGLEVGTLVIDYLNLVPLIANDPQRMKEETERYEKKLHHSLVGHFESTAMSQNSSWAEWKIFLHGLALHQHMMIHQVLCMSAEEFEEWKENEGWEEAEEEEVDEDEKMARALSYEAIPQLTPAWKQLIHTSAKITLDSLCSYCTDLKADRELLEDREAYGKLRSTERYALQVRYGQKMILHKLLDLTLP